MASKVREMRAALHQKQGGKCWLCGLDVDLQLATLDHVIPRAAGGASHAHNLRLACRICNHTKGRTIPDVPVTKTMLVSARTAKRRLNRSGKLTNFKEWERLRERAVARTTMHDTS